MTRKDYVLIAQAFALFNYLDQPTRYFIALALADGLEKDNPRFDRARFIESCDLWPHRRNAKTAHSCLHNDCTDSELLHVIVGLFDRPEIPPDRLSKFSGTQRDQQWVDSVEELLLNARSGTTLPARYSA